MVLLLWRTLLQRSNKRYTDEKLRKAMDTVLQYVNSYYGKNEPMDGGHGKAYLGLPGTKGKWGFLLEKAAALQRTH